MDISKRVIGNYTVDLLKSVLFDSTPKNKPEALSWHEIYDFCNNHNVSAMAYYAVKKLCLSENELSEFYEDYKKFTLREARQQLMTERLLSDFDKEKIECMPMKGFSLKTLYPIENMRYSVDIDMYINGDKATAANEVMLKNGFRFHSAEYEQLIYYKQPIYNYELHTSIVESGMTGSEYFSKAYDRGVPYLNYNFARCMNNEDLVIHSVVHFYKHFVGEGAGLRFLLDLYLINTKLDFDKDYVKKTLCDMKLYEFYKRMTHLSEIWFGKEEYTEDYEKIADFIFLNNTFGDSDVGASNRANLDKSKKISIFRRILNHLKWWFLGLEDMKKFYPVLNKAPFLLPFCWIHKGVKTLIKKPQAIKRETEKLKLSMDIKKIYKLSGIDE